MQQADHATDPSGAFSSSTRNPAGVIDESISNSTTNPFEKSAGKDIGKKPMPGDPGFTRQTAPLSGQRAEPDGYPQKDVSLEDTHVANTDTNKDMTFEQMTPPMLNQFREARPPQWEDSPKAESSIKNKAPRRESVQSTKKEPSINSNKLRLPQPLLPVDPQAMTEGLEILAFVYIALAGLCCYLFGKMKFGIWIGLLAVGGGALLAYWVRGNQAEECLNWQLEKKEGAKTLQVSHGETVEWLNYFLQKIWRAIDPEIFVSVEDILEDTLQSIAPGFIKAVKVSDFDIGVCAPRIETLQVFPPLPGQPDEAIFGQVAFNFRAKSTKRGRTTAPPGLAIRFKTGIKAPIDIKAELVNVSGNLRFKILTSPDPPFVSKVTIAFTSVPKIETSVMPLSQYMNVMRMPLIKTLVDEGVKLGFADLIDPKSMTVDIQALMGAASKDTSAIGVIMAEIREVERDGSLLHGDRQDFYATLSVSKGFNRRPGRTRVLTNDGHPRWYENIYTLVYEDDIIAEADVDVKVWDADKVKFDGVLGSVSMSVKDAVRGELDDSGNVKHWAKDPITLFDGWAPIDGKPTEESKARLLYKLSFHPKYVVPVKNMLMQKKVEDESVFDPVHRGGILSVQITEAKDLEIGDPGVISAEELKHPYSPNQSVNPYALLYLNDTKVFETRAKLRNPCPHWNAVTEQFVKDFASSYIRISVKTSVDLENDPVLGTKTLRLVDLFESQEDKYKEAERWIPLSNGIGFGKVLLNLKYKPVKLTLPDELRGADVGTLIVERLDVNTLRPPLNSGNAQSCRAVLSLNVSPETHERLKARDLSGEGDGTFSWKDKHLFFPLMQRYQTALYIHLQQGVFGKQKAVGRVWLKTLSDNTVQEVSVGLYEHRAEKEDNGNEDVWDSVGPLGQLRLQLRVVPGFSPVHARLRCFRRDMCGADPFQESPEHHEEHTEINEMRASIGSELSEEYEQEANEDEAEGQDWAILEKSRHQMTNAHLGRTQVLRKLSRGSDLVRDKIGTLRGGFNSEARASRSAAKED